MWLRLSRRAERELLALPTQDQHRISAAIDRFEATGYGDLIKLKGRQASYRLRVGNLRVLFEDRGVDGLWIIGVRHRGSAYRH
jgi:mRNA-degrading endonuclease RelE of RelBE toxin-antitoxin system